MNISSKWMEVTETHTQIGEYNTFFNNQIMFHDFGVLFVSEIIICVFLIQNKILTD